jgi:monovalent cation:H+ antiporter, CPA1 family
MLEFFGIIITISAVFGYINHKWLKLHTTTSVMLISDVLRISLKVIEGLNPNYISPLRNLSANLSSAHLYLILFRAFY